MVGNIVLCIVGVLLLALVVALRIPVHARASYDQGELAAWIRYGPVKLQLFPPARPEQKEAKQPEAAVESAPAQEPEKKPKKGKRKKKPKAKINREQIFYSLEALPPILLRALRRVGRRIWVEPLKLHILVAGADWKPHWLGPCRLSIGWSGSRSRTSSCFWTSQEGRWTLLRMWGYPSARGMCCQWGSAPAAAFLNGFGDSGSWHPRRQRRCQRIRPPHKRQVS